MIRVLLIQSNYVHNSQSIYLPAVPNIGDIITIESTAPFRDGKYKVVNRSFAVAEHVISKVTVEVYPLAYAE